MAAERTKPDNWLRWHLHELDPSLHVLSRGIRRYCVIDDLTDHLANVEGTLARTARDLLTRCRKLTLQFLRAIRTAMPRRWTSARRSPWS